MRLQITIALTLFFATVMVACIAAAETRSISGSPVILRDTTLTGAVAEIMFINRTDNSDADTGKFDLSHGDVSTESTFYWNARGSADAITVEPADGLICVPSCMMTVQENDSDTIYLFPLEGVGF